MINCSDLMTDKIFILTDKCEFIPDEKMEKTLVFNIQASGYVFNKTLEYSINREILVKEFGIGDKYKVNRDYAQEILPTLKEKKTFLKDADATCLQASTDRLIKSYQGYYKRRTGKPHFKSRKKNPVKSITLRNNYYRNKKGEILYTIRWENDNVLRLNKLGHIKVKHKRDIDGKIKEVTIKYKNERWYVCIIYEMEKIEPKDEFSPFGLYVGIDVGITDFLTFSTGKVIAKPDLKKINGKIISLQQKMARQKCGGANWKKTHKKLLRWINKKNNIINDYYHKISYNIVKHCKFIAMETLNIRGMLRCQNISHSIHEIGWGKLINMIKYKAEWYGREFFQINQWFPSSKKCWVCGTENKGLDRGDRQWECQECHAILPRDLNAALNILDEGLRASGSWVQCLVDFVCILPPGSLETITICTA